MAVLQAQTKETRKASINRATSMFQLARVCCILIWKFPTAGAQMVGLLLQGHPQKGPPIYRNSHMLLAIINTTQKQGRAMPLHGPRPRKRQDAHGWDAQDGGSQGRRAAGDEGVVDPGPRMYVCNYITYTHIHVYMCVCLCIYLHTYMHVYIHYVLRTE